MWLAREQRLGHVDFKGHGEDFESYSDSGSVFPLWSLALGPSSPGGGGQKGKGRKHFPSSQRPKLFNGDKLGTTAPMWTLRSPPTPSARPSPGVGSGCWRPEEAHNAGHVETPRGIRISVWEQKPLSNCGLSPFPFVSLPWEHPARKPEAP